MLFLHNDDDDHLEPSQRLIKCKEIRVIYELRRAYEQQNYNCVKFFKVVLQHGDVLDLVLQTCSQ